VEVTRPLYETHIAQDEEEISAFVALLREERITRFLEIGSRHGGSLWRIATSMARGSRAVAVDLPGSAPGGQPSAGSALRACIVELRRLGYDAHLIEGNSRHSDVIARARALGPYDCIFIDADHTIAGVTADWENYGPMGKMIAFHDITNVKSTKPIHVSKLWEKIRTEYRHQEFKLHRTERHNGIGVLWR
jgi:cephalosporin hydroxylase